MYKSRKVSSRGPRNQVEVSEDEIDAFHNQREKVLLGEHSDDNYANADDSFDEAVMDISNSSDQDSEELSEDEHVEDEQEKGWGRSKKAYYSADGEVDDLEDEAKEAKKLQKRQLASLNAEDFGPVFLTKKAAKGPVNLELSECEESESKDDDTISQSKEEFEDRFATEEEISKLSSSKIEALLSKNKKVSKMEKKSKELQYFFNDFREKISEMKEYIEPTMKQLEDYEAQQELSFIRAKYQLLLGYCANLAFFLLLKSEGDVKDNHPVIERLVKYRLLFEKIKLTDVKYEVKIEKILQLTDNNSLSGNGDKEALQNKDEEISIELEEASTSVSDGECNDIRCDDEILMNEKFVHVSNAPKLPQNPLRFTLTEEERNNINGIKNKSITGNLGLSKESIDTSAVNGNKSKRAVEKLLGLKMKKEKKVLGGDDDIPEKKRKRYDSRHASNDAIDEMTGNRDELEGEDDFYRSSKEKQLAKKASKPSINANPSHDSIKDIENNKERPASYKMIKNRGLTPNRAKESRNPHLRQRSRWEKAQKKIKSFKSVKSDTNSAYRGELSGIRTNLSRSVKF